MLLIFMATLLAFGRGDDFRPSIKLGPIKERSWPTSPGKPHWLGTPISVGDFHYNPPQFPEFNLTPDSHVARRGSEGQRRFKRRRNKQRQQRRRGRQGQTETCAEGSGVCRNFLSCMMSGLKMNWRATSGSCNTVFHVCCTKWGINSGSPQRPRKRQTQRPQKAGRALNNAGPPPVQNSNVIKYYTSPELAPVKDYTLNTIEDGSTNQWHTHKVTQEEHCGVSKNANSRIMGGLDAGYGQFPWTAHIKINGPGIDKVCGGTLVNRRWVVTAGHCTQYCQDVPNCDGEISQLNIQYKVILGEYDQLSQIEEYPTESYLAVEVIRHPEYRNVMRYHYNGFLESEPRFDVAVLKLDRDVRPAPNVAPICLPTSSHWSQPSVGPPGTLATVVGWGRLGREEDAPHSNILQAVTVPILDENECAFQTGLGVYPDQLCAGGSDVERSACPGDSGGGLQVRDEGGRWTLVGVVSNGPSVCGLQPVIFHKIEETLPWIIQTMRIRSGQRLSAP